MGPRASAPRIHLTIDRGGRLATSATHEQAVVGLLRQLATGLSAYRMFPGDLKQPAFVGAVKRIRTAAAEALSSGPIRTSVLASRFSTDDGPLPSDEIVQRLATACYERRVEILDVRSVPDVHDLASLYRALSLTPAEVGDLGGAQGILALDGVVSICLGEQAPRPQDDFESPSEDLPQALRRLESPAKLAADLLPREEGGSAVHRAEVVLRGFHELVWSLPPRYAEDPEVYGRLREVMRYLPVDTYRILSAMLLERSQDDPVAMRMIGTMTDTDLARLLIELGRTGGPNPDDAARRLADVGARRSALVDLVATLAAQEKRSASDLPGGAGWHPSFGGPAPDAPLAQALSDLLGGQLLDTKDEDLQAIRQAFPASEEERRAVTLQALRDYLRTELDRGRMEMVMEAWEDRGREAVRSGIPARAAVVVHAMEGVLDIDRPDPEVSALLHGYRRNVLDPDTLDAVLAGAGPDSTQRLRTLLDPFGEAAVDRLFDLVAEERDVGRGPVVMGMLVSLAPRYLGAVAARLADHRPSVAKAAVTVVARSGRTEALQLLFRAVRHRDGTVRSEAVRVFPSVAGPDAVPVLRAITSDPDPAVQDAAVTGLGSLLGGDAARALGDFVRQSTHPAIRGRALEQLAQHPAAEVLDLLRDLAFSRTRPKLPRALRRRARGFLRERGDGR